MQTRVRSVLVGVVVASFAARGWSQENVRRLPVKEYRDKMKAGWIGQIIGVSWGAPTEGRFREIMPPDKMPPFQDTLVNNAFNQDDLYVEMTFLRSMEQYGFDVPIRQAGIDFANSGYALWVANYAGRTNLRNGIAPPDSSHPKFHNCAGAIDYQIEADYAGLIAPGMPDRVIALGEKFGRLMNYGDGVYAGQFIGVLYAEAFFEKDVHKLIEAGLKSIPSECMYAEMVRDLVKWHRENPDNWETTWRLVDEKYRKNKQYYISALDVKLEGAFVLMGLLYGEGDPDKIMTISCRCGSDSDCNPSSSGGIIFTTLGISHLPDRYYRKLDETKVFSHTAYNFPALMAVCEKLARDALVRSGGRIEKTADGEEVFVIPVKTSKPSRFEDLKNPGAIADSRFTDDEMAKIQVVGLQWALPKYLPGWEMRPAPQTLGFMHREWKGRKNVWAIALPGGSKSDWTLTRKVEVAAGKKTHLALAAGCDVNSEGWELTVKADEKELARKPLRKDTTQDGWMKVNADLSGFAGKTVSLDIVGMPQKPGERSRPVCYLSDISIVGE